MSEEKSLFSIPTWAGKPPHGTHLDVTKNGSVIQKLLIDEKGCYYFGRNPTHCDFIIEHASSSRVHAILIYHSVLRKFALVDLKSSHGTCAKGIRIDSLQPVFVEYDDEFHFGASTRRYVVRSRLRAGADGADSSMGEDKDYNLPELEQELDNLTSYNTMQNRRVTAIPITVEEARRKSRPRGSVAFLEEEDVINPEDVDPSVGRFRNLVQTAVVSGGKRKTPATVTTAHGGSGKRRILLPGKDTAGAALPYSSVLGGVSLSAAPSLDLYSNVYAPTGAKASGMGATTASADDEASRKKKYAKEAWPGRKPPLHAAI